jgi:hypothetical protein
MLILTIFSNIVIDSNIKSLTVFLVKIRMIYQSMNTIRYNHVLFLDLIIFQQGFLINP